MEIQVKLTERQYKILKDWCVANNIDTAEYLGKKIWEAFMVDKYGDLNDKAPKVVDKKEEKEPEGVVMAPYELQLENVVTITTPKELPTEETKDISERYKNKKMDSNTVSEFNVSETSEEEPKKEEKTPSKSKTPKKIELKPVK